MKINDEETSIYVETEIDSIEIQKYLFSHGYHWLDHHNNPHQKIIVCPLNVIFNSYTIYFNGAKADEIYKFVKVYSEPVPFQKLAGY